jgi:hypothetical protein
MHDDRKDIIEAENKKFYEYLHSCCSKRSASKRDNSNGSNTVLKKSRAVKTKNKLEFYDDDSSDLRM